MLGKIQQKPMLQIGLGVLIVVIALGVIFWYVTNGTFGRKENRVVTDLKVFSYEHYAFKFKETWSTWQTLQSTPPAECFVQGDSACVYHGKLAFSVNILTQDQKTCQNYYNGAGGPKAVLAETRIINGKPFLYGKFTDDNLEIYHLFANGHCYELAKTISDDRDLNRIISSFALAVVPNK